MKASDNSNSNNSSLVNLPIFAFPANLSFNVNDKTTYKQILTIYNPYDFTIRFKVLSNCPINYILSDSEGLIKAKCGVDILIRYADKKPLKELVSNKFRLQIYEYGVDKIIGKKDIKVILNTSSPEVKTDHDFSSNQVNARNRAAVSDDRDGAYVDNDIVQETGLNIAMVAVAFVCVGVLLLPSPEDDTPKLPSFLQVPNLYKLIAAYLLGMITCAVLRS